MKSYGVFRTHLSPYQSQNFTELERNTLEKIPGLSYGNIDEEDLILITNTHTEIGQLDPQILKRTRLIVHPNSGYDHFEKDYRLWSEIPVIVGHTIRAQAVAEYTLGCLIQGSSEMPQHLVWDKNRNWDRKLISEMEIWVYGLGHIGQIVTRILKSLGAKVVTIDPFKADADLKHWRSGHRRNAHAHLLTASLNHTSKHLLNFDFFQDVRGDAIIVNGARGGLIDGNSLKDFLLTNPRALAFLDVFEKEPFHGEWMNVPNVWKTSHIAGVSRHLDQKVIEFETMVLQDFTHLFKTDFMAKYKNECLQNKFFDGVLI
jgi:D-3-phosphoglycerate dehydrogenase